MPWQLPLSQTTAVNLGTSFDAYIAPNVTINVSNAIAIRGTGGAHDALVYGNVASNVEAIQLGDDPNVAFNSVTVMAGGHVQTLTDDAAILLYGWTWTVTNFGTISSLEGDGVDLYGSGGTGSFRNGGTITAERYAIRVNGTQGASIENTGTISAPDGTAYSGGVLVDTFTNKGTVAGNIWLNLGNDLYDGRAGKIVQGEVYAFGGNDTVQGGSAKDIFFGEDDNDRLFGYGGNDELSGGLGTDRLTGGTHKDVFVFDAALNGTTNVDLITDFVVVDDAIRLENGIFTALAAGKLNAAMLRINTTGNAQDANDHIIYERDTGELYYDQDGSGTGSAAIEFATMSKNLALTSADFVVV